MNEFAYLKQLGDEHALFRQLLEEVRQCFTHENELPGDLLERIDAALNAPSHLSP